MRLRLLNNLPTAVLTAVTVLVGTGCGAQLDNGVPNLVACKQISQAIAAKCTIATDFQWLNCDELPGCPGGEVEQSDVESCVSRIESAPQCVDALVISCEIKRLDCQDPAGDIGVPSEMIGFKQVCPYIAFGLNNYGCGHAADGLICQNILGCSGGVFNFTDILQLIKAVNDVGKAGGTCAEVEETAAQFAADNNLRRKYCLPVDET